MVIKKITKLKKIELCHNKIVNQRKDTLRLHQMGLECQLIHSEASVLKKQLEAESLGDSMKQTLCNKLEEILQKLELLVFVRLLEFVWVFWLSGCREYYANIAHLWALKILCLRVNALAGKYVYLCVNFLFHNMWRFFLPVFVF